MSLENSYNTLNEKDFDAILAQAFLENYSNIVKLNLQTGEAIILKTNLEPAYIHGTYPWSELIDKFARKFVCLSDTELILSATLERLRESIRNETKDFPVSLRCRTKTEGFQWWELNVIGVKAEAKEADIALISTRVVESREVFHKITALFVNQNYDYLLLIDSKKDSYTRITQNGGSNPVPPEYGEHYTRDMIHYNRKYVAEEDYERVTANMQLSHIIQMLEKTEIYSFTSGGITNDGNYRRSRISFLYYDKAAGSILAARTDVTQIYLEEQERNRQLAEALQGAQHDAMTGIYNQKATTELIKQSLIGRYRSMAAFLFIDVDNFKMVNDTLGHQKGDDLLCYLAHSLQEIAGYSGIAGRLGGDEYLLYLPDISSIPEIREIAQQICRIFDQYSETVLPANIVSCSVGISIYPYDGTDYETLLRRADQALYISKRYGKSMYFFYSNNEEEKPPSFD